MSIRKQTTNILTEAAIDHWTKLRYSAFREIGFSKWGRTRADVLAINLKGILVANEVKSGWADYKSDFKWYKYRPFVQSLFLTFDQTTYAKHKTTIDLDVKAYKAGVMVLCPTSGYLKTVIKCPKLDVDTETARLLTIRLAWRAGESKRTRVRRTRRFITDVAVSRH